MAKFRSQLANEWRVKGNTDDSRVRPATCVPRHVVDPRHAF
jgi:hypothetical protein